MPEVVDLKLTIAFHHPSGRVPSRDLTRCMEHCEEAVYSSELHDLSSLYGPDEGDMPLALIDAMRFRLERMRGRLLHLEHASEGSIVLGAIVAAAALWVLENTLGETFKEAWKESQFHKKIKSVFLAKFTQKPQRIAEDLKRRIDNDEDLSLRADIAITSPADPFVAIFVHVTPKAADPVDRLPLRSHYL